MRRIVVRLAVMVVAGMVGWAPAGAAEPTCFGKTATIVGVPPTPDSAPFTTFTGTDGPDVIIGTNSYDEAAPAQGTT